MATKAKKLPDKPSALIRLALADLRKCERSKKKYKVDMREWHHPNGACSVCLAGSVIAKSLGANPREHISPSEFDKDTGNKLYALNSFRMGLVVVGLANMRIPEKPELPYSRSICPYEFGASKFHCDMNQLANDLEAHGL